MIYHTKILKFIPAPPLYTSKPKTVLKSLLNNFCKKQVF